MQDVQAEGVMMRGWASMCLCEWASMCPCEWASMCLCKWACVRASEMGRCENHEGVGIHVGGQDISVWGNAGGHRCSEGEGECIHVGGSRWNPCENVQVGMDVMSTRGHPCRNMQASSRWESLDVGGMHAVHGWGEYGEMLLHNIPTQVSTLWHGPSSPLPSIPRSWASSPHCPKSLPCYIRDIPKLHASTLSRGC